MSLEILGAEAPAPSLSKVRAGKDFVQRGMAGKSVKAVQRMLGMKPADGIFGGGTENAVKAFQAARGPKVDGVVGQETLAALEGGLPDTSAPGTVPQVEVPTFALTEPQVDLVKAAKATPVKAAAAATAVRGCGAAGMTPAMVAAFVAVVLLLLFATLALDYVRIRRRRRADLRRLAEAAWEMHERGKTFEARMA